MSEDEDVLDQSTKSAIRLLSAVNKGDTEKVANFLASGVDPNTSDYDSRTGLHIAACLGHLDIIKCFVRAGADVNAKDRWDSTPMDDAIECKQTACADYLTEMGGKCKSGSPAPRHARKSNESGTVLKQLRQSELELMHRCAEGNINEVKALLQRDDCDVNASDYDRRTALHVAAAEGMLPIVRVLIKAGANVNSRDRWGNTALAEALRSNWSDVATILQENGAEAPSHSSFKSIDDSTVSDKLDLDGANRVFAQLHARGVAEKWALDIKEIHLESEPFARGTTGELFFAKWRKMKCVAKRCFNFDIQSPRFLANFAEQLSAMSHMRHPNVVMFLGACFAVEQPLLLMEYCSEGTLQDKLEAAARGEFKYRNQLKRIQMLELALGMNSLHCCKPQLLHCDLEPSNVLLSDHLHAKVTDFGLRRFVGPDEDGPKLNTNTFRYMAPEAYEGEEYSTKSDMYSYGMILYYVYSGQEPFHTIQDAQDAARAAAKGKRPALSDVPSPLRPLLTKCWDSNPSNRPTFDEVIELFEGKIGSDLMKAQRGSCTLS